MREKQHKYSKQPMKNNNYELEDDFRTEYNSTRKSGSRGKDLSSTALNDVNNEIDFLVNALATIFISRRTKLQEQLISLQKNTDWKVHRKYFQFGIAFSMTIFFILLKITVDLSKRNDFQSYRFIGIILLFSSLFFLVAAMLCVSFEQFASIWEDFRTYQDEINSIGESIKKNIRKNSFYVESQKRSIQINSRMNGVAFFKSHLENRIKKIENNLKIVEPLSYLFAVLCIALIFLIYSPSFLNFFIQDSTKYSLLLGILLFLIAIIQSTLKLIAYNSGYSLIRKHQECLLLIDEMSIMAGSPEQISLLLQSSGSIEP